MITNIFNQILSAKIKPFMIFLVNFIPSAAAEPLVPQSLAAHRYLAVPFGQLKIIGRPKTVNIQFCYLRFVKPYMTAARLRG